MFSLSCTSSVTTLKEMYCKHDPLFIRTDLEIYLTETVI